MASERCWWHRSRPSVGVLTYRGRRRHVCSSCDEQIIRILNALDAQLLDRLVEDTADAVRDFIEASSHGGTG